MESILHRILAVQTLSAIRLLSTKQYYPQLVVHSSKIITVHGELVELLVPRQYRPSTSSVRTDYL